LRASGGIEGVDALDQRVGQEHAIARQGLHIADHQPARLHFADDERIVPVPGHFDPLYDQVGQLTLR
jgi:hypothetical protein